MDGPQAVLLVDQGNIAGLFVPTRGVDTEQRVYQALADRYGKPLQEARVALRSRPARRSTPCACVGQRTRP